MPYILQAVHRTPVSSPVSCPEALCQSCTGLDTAACAPVQNAFNPPTIILENIYFIYHFRLQNTLPYIMYSMHVFE